MSAVCPDGHTSGSADYCDVCGLPIGAAPATPAPAAAPAGEPPAPAVTPCPHCGADAPGDALFCEECGYDFTTGALPPPPVSVEVSAGAVPAPDGVGAGESGPPAGATGAAPAPAPPPTVAGSAAGAAAGADPVGAGGVEWVAEVWVDPDWYAVQDSTDPCPSPGMPVVVPLVARSLLIGRRSVSRNITPQIDGNGDTAISRRHAQLTTDGLRWWVEDLQSANGTFLARAGDPLPEDPLPPGRRTEFSPGDRIYCGAWTRIVVRHATEDER